MIPTRVIPALLLRGTGLVKTVRFDQPKYLGDPRNTVKIFNDKEVDELALLDIRATRDGRDPNYALIREIVDEAFMPVAYGGGLRTVEQARQMLQMGVEKVVLNTAAFEQPELVSRMADRFGSQSVVVSIDAKRGFLGRYEIVTHDGTRKQKIDPVSFAQTMERAGAGEIFLNSVDRDGTFEGYDVPLIRSVAEAVTIPVVACGGASSVDDMVIAVKEGRASAVAAGSFFVFHGKHRSVLITYPDAALLRDKLPHQGEF
ncbi:MAG: imidazole glycerol phosphate synthase subunit HisF [Rhodothermales bacterium]|nr:imidazole glycerol phosphate synthase subunit HisF [Rhodothermales bacterium]